MTGCQSATFVWSLMAVGALAVVLLEIVGVCILGLWVRRKAGDWVLGKPL